MAIRAATRLRERARMKIVFRRVGSIARETAFGESGSLMKTGQTLIRGRQLGNFTALWQQVRSHPLGDIGAELAGGATGATIRPSGREHGRAEEKIVSLRLRRLRPTLILFCHS